jgi:hypothetical protein
MDRWAEPPISITWPLGASHRVDEHCSVVGYLVAGFLVLGILLSALAVWLWG